MGERQEIGGYQLLEQIGYGGMSTVYAAQDGAGNRVAFKLLHPALADSAGRERLAREVAMLLRVKGSRVAEVLDAETDAEDAFIVTELIDGDTLEQDVAEEGVYEGEELADLADELSQAIRSIHAAGVLHRDLKPSNVMMSEDGPVLIDFGIAQLGDDTRLTEVGSVAQTPGYCDPRVVSGAQPDEEADWWALAAVLLFAATGRAPFGTGTTDAILRRVLDGQADVGGLDEPIAQAFLAALAPRNRIDIETLTEILRHTDSAQQLLPSRSDEPTQVLSQEKTRVYETLPTQVQEAQAAQEALMPSEGISGGEIATVAQALPHDDVRDSVVAGTTSPVVAGGVSDEAIPHYGTDELTESEQQTPPWAQQAPKSAWLVLLIGLTLSVYGSVWLGVAASIYMLFLILCVTWGLLVGELRERRLERGGVDSRDRLGVVVRLPWAFVRAVLLSILNVLIGIAAFALVLFLLRTFLADVHLIPQSSGEKAPLPYPVFVGISFFVLLLVSWLVPMNKRGREGARSILQSLAPGWTYKLFWTIIFIIGIGIGLVIVGGISHIEWFPLPNISNSLPGLFKA